MTNPSPRLCAMLVLVLVSLWISPSSSLTPADVQTVCNATPNPKFCTAFLNAIPNLPAVSVLTAITASVDAAESSAAGTLQFIKDLERRFPGDHELNEVLVKIEPLFNDGVEKLLSAQQTVRHGDLDTTNGVMVQIQRMVDQCEEITAYTSAETHFMSSFKKLSHYASIAISLYNFHWTLKVE